MDRPVVEPHAAVAIEPGESVFQPIFVIPLWKILPRMGAAAFSSSDSEMKTHTRLRQHIVEFERFREVCAEDH
jgi:hypothetical protein